MNFDFLKKLLKKDDSEKKGNSHYLSAKETREIAKNNARTIRELEKRKKRVAVEEEYTTVMRDDNNIVEFDNLKTHFFGDAGVVTAVDAGNTIIRASITVDGVTYDDTCTVIVTANEG